MREIIRGKSRPSMRAKENVVLDYLCKHANAALESQSPVVSFVFVRKGHYNTIIADVADDVTMEDLAVCASKLDPEGVFKVSAERKQQMINHKIYRTYGNKHIGLHHPEQRFLTYTTLEVSKLSSERPVVLEINYRKCQDRISETEDDKDDDDDDGQDNLSDD